MSKRFSSQDAVSGPLAGMAKQVKPSSNRSFGLVLAAAFGVVGLWPLVHAGAIRYWALTVAACFLLVAMVHPQSLTRLNQWWMRIGILLGRIVSPIALAVVYYLAIVPVGLCMRWFGKDALGLRFDSSAPSYWVARNPKARPDDSMKNQF